ncbi:OmpA family protein [Brevibacterium gallinarum]|uniref:OmpA family protein n=1 Tax=Brevibacterium gallinarum TaxID=2762220 RepID=A0ABR8WSF2_9MICO|nr:OmpA family protein [Brevibacterium gallinarum]MBD8019959.1 OmpA family protein [Brevibacterium gallinarum]
MLGEGPRQCPCARFSDRPLFALDADTLDAKADGVIASTADELKRTAQGQTVTVEGHTDDQGEDAYNQSLSERRAEAVKQALESKLDGTGITLQTKGYGESQPSVPNTGADGQPIEKNRALNRQVSFTYTPAAEVKPNVDTGEQLPDIPEMEPANGAAGATSGASGGQAPIASGILTPPEGNPGSELRLDVDSLTEAGDFYVLSYSFRTADGSADEQALAGDPANPEALHFGQNPETTLRSYATSANLALHDDQANLLARPVTAGGSDCLCAQNGVKDAAFGEPIRQLAYFPKQGLDSETLSLRVAETGRLEIPVR